MAADKRRLTPMNTQYLSAFIGVYRRLIRISSRPLTDLLRLALLSLLGVQSLAAQWGGELRLSIRSEPPSFHPALADSDSAETIRYLTGGVLVRVNRSNQQLEPELATSWEIENGGKSIVFQLRPGLLFSDGTPFTADDVVYTMQVLLDPALHSATGDAFQGGGGAVQAVPRGKYEVAVVFPEPVANAARLFDQVAIMSRNSPLKERAVLGAFRIAGHKPGSFILLARNPNYWKTERGRRLPYLDGIRLEIQQNRELELLRFRRGEVHLISALAPDQFQQLAAEDGATVKDAGPTLESEVLWFNLNPSAPIEAYRKNWFGSRNFRLAVSHAIRRDDLCRVVYHGHAQPGIGPFPPANRFWFNQSLKPHRLDLDEARRLLAADGFHLAGQSGGQSGGQALRDRDGHAVEFNVITNAGNPARERMAAMLQQDLGAIGIRLNIVTLDFPSLIERIGKSSQYESCLLGNVNVDLDPNGQLNLWLSSSANHQWNPNQAKPATAWEAEIDRLVRLQSTLLDENRRKTLFDRVQQIVWDEAPFLYLVNRNALVAASRSLRNVEPSALRPNILWNAERLWIETK
jgi:peptide/nickel transport system substrate-binding protein